MVTRDRLRTGSRARSDPGLLIEAGLGPFFGAALRPRTLGATSAGEALDATLETLHRRREAQAVDAWNLGQAAFAAGEVADAARWLDRARRIAPDDATVQLMLGLVRLRQGNPALAAELLGAVLRTHDLRVAWLALAQARRLSGQHRGAAAALATALSRHAAPVDPALRALAQEIAAEAGAPGWCALDSTGVLRVAAAGDPQLRLDGRARRLPPDRIIPAAWRGLLEVRAGPAALLGSPLDLDAIRGGEGCVEVQAGGLEGWAWHPHDPERDPVLQIVVAGGRSRRQVISELIPSAAGHLPFARPRRFHLPAATLQGGAGPVSVLLDGRDLLGSPLDPGAEIRSGAVLTRHAAALYPATRRRTALPAAVVPFASVAAGLRPAPAAAGGRPPVAIVMPVYRGLAATRACLDSLLATVPADVAIVVVDDATPDPAILALLDRLAEEGRIRLLRHAANQGFPAAANTGIRACPGADIVLLNSDTLVPPGWLDRLSAAAHAAPDIGSVTPLSNDATILSYPDVDGGNPVPDPAATRRLAALAYRTNGDAVVEIPTGIGFCMYIRRACLDAVGLFRADLFAQGYGEENDFCLRARHLGWRHVAATGLFVGHVGGSSFGAARRHLMARNMAVLERLHPGYGALIAAFRAADPLAPVRRRLDLARFPPARGRRAVLLVTHDMGGGVERQVASRIAALAAEGLRPIVLRPKLRHPGICRVADGADRLMPNLGFRLPEELAALKRFLRARDPIRIELHHFVGHAPELRDLCGELGLPTEVYIHDWSWFCPRITLIGPERRYCGEPDVVTCEDCIADAGRNDEEDIPVAALRARSAAQLRQATRVVVPSADAASRIRRHFPGTAAEIVAWDAARPRPLQPSPAAGRADRLRICVLGGIGTEKGYDLLLASARDAARRALPLDFIVVGYTVDDARLLQTGVVFVTGEYKAAELPALIAAQQAQLAWVPSIWPETWCFTLSELWRAGLDVVVFDIGAPAERVRAHGGGIVLPLGLSPAALNNTLLSRRLAVWSTDPAGQGRVGRSSVERTIDDVGTALLDGRRAERHPT